MKRISFFAILMFIFSFPPAAFAFDITGWWKNDKINVLMLITDSKIWEFPYKIISKNDKKITLIIDNTSIKSYIEPIGEEAFIFTDAIGEKNKYILLTHDINLPYAEVRKLAKMN